MYPVDGNGAAQTWAHRLVRRISYDTRRSSVFIGALVLLCCGITGCETVETVDVGGGGAARKAAPAHGKLGIPPGHLPPPGQCRIWYPGYPPGRQPPPGDCDRLRRQVPAGAWLIERPTYDRKHVRVNVYDPRRAGNRIEIRIYNASTGVYVRAEIP